MVKAYLFIYCAFRQIMIICELDYITQDNEPTLAARHRRSDAREIQSYYQQYYNDYVKALEQPEHSDRCGAYFEECLCVREDTVLSRDVIIINRYRLVSVIILMCIFHFSDFDSICIILAPELNLCFLLEICVTDKFRKNVEVKVL